MKHINITLILTMLMSMVGVQVSAHDFEAKNSDGVTIYYGYNNGSTGSTVSVTHRGNYYDSYSSEYSGNVIIPETVTYNGNTYNVTKIKDSAFRYCKNLTSVTIPNSVTNIGDYAFSLCSGLTSVTIPNSVTSIGSSAFSSCSRLTSVTIPSSVTSIDYRAFSDCSGLTSVTIPNSVTSIGSSAFSSCSRLTSVTIPNSVTSIGDNAFNGCSGLKSVTIPASVTSIGNDAFSNCSGLTSVTWKAVNYPSFSRYTSNPFYGIRKQITEFKISENITKIPAYLCYGMSKLSSVTIPESVTSIGYQAFNGCSGLTSVTIPNNVTSIGSEAFAGCSGLTSATWNAINYIVSYTGSPFSNNNDKITITEFKIGENVTKIPAYLCRGMSNLKSITIPASVDSIGEKAFMNCTGLTHIYVDGANKSYSSVDGVLFSYDKKILAIYPGGREGAYVIPNSVDSIGNDAFYLCKGLTSVTIGNSVTRIGRSAFYGCSGLTSVTWNAMNYPDFSSYSSNPFYNIREQITEFKISENITKIPAYLCYGMSKLSSVTIPSSVTSIGYGAFYGCSGLTSVTIPERVDSIGDYTFYNCSGLTSVTIGNSVTNIGHVSFYGCSSLTTITIPASVTNINSSAFHGCSGLASVTWNAVNYPDISQSSSNPFYNIREQITEFKIGENVTKIPKYLCYGMSKLTSVTIPESVTNISSNVFDGCTGLASITWNTENYPDISQFSSNPFYNIREQITEFKIGEEVSKIPACLCYEMSKLANIIIPESVTNIGANAFNGCSSLTTITIPASVTCIGSYAFYSCSGLTSVTWNAVNYPDFSSYDYNPFYNIRKQITEFKIGENVTKIPAWLCCSMDKLTSITIPEGVTSIGNYAFSGCTGLTSINIPESVDSIGGYAFSGCAITSVTIPSSVTTIGENPFYCYGLESITVDSKNAAYDSRNGCNAIIRKKDSSLISACVSTTIPDGVVAIANGAFSDFRKDVLIIPSSVTSVGSLPHVGLLVFLSDTPPSNDYGVYYTRALAPYGSIDKYKSWWYRVQPIYDTDVRFFSKPTVQEYKDAMKTIDKKAITSIAFYSGVDDELSTEVIKQGVNPNCLYYVYKNESDYSGQYGNGLPVAANIIDMTSLTADSLILYDNYAFNCPCAFTATKAHLKHTPKVWADGENGWQTMCVPFNVTSYKASTDGYIFPILLGAEGEFWLREFVGASSKALYFTSTYDGQMKANTPYLVAFPGNKMGNGSLEGQTITFIGKNVTVDSNAMTDVQNSDKIFTGNYDTKPDKETGWILNSSGNSFVRSKIVGDKPFCGYFKTDSDADAMAKSLSISFCQMEDEETDVDNISVNENVVDSHIYTIDGTQVRNADSTNLKSGLYIINKKKVFVR